MLLIKNVWHVLQHKVVNLATMLLPQLLTTVLLARLEKGLILTLQKNVLQDLLTAKFIKLVILLNVTHVQMALTVMAQQMLLLHVPLVLQLQIVQPVQQQVHLVFVQHALVEEDYKLMRLKNACYVQQIVLIAQELTQMENAKKVHVLQVMEYTQVQHCLLDAQHVQAQIV